MQGKKKKSSFEDRVSRHFLFNSLNAVISLCSKDPEAAAGLVGEISTYLQTSLEEKPFFIALEEELEHAVSYLHIQKARFADRLKIILDIEEGVKCMIPPFMLQPILDNAVRHGVLKRKQGGAVTVSINKLSGSVRICVSDDGPGMSAGELASLFKRRNRNHSLYIVNRSLKKAGSRGLQIDSGLGRGTAVCFDIPSAP